MARKKSNTPDNRQQLFQFINDFHQIAEMLSLEGGTQENLSEFELRFRMSLKEAIEGCGKRDAEPLDRIDIAARMSRLLGREVTKAKIDSWTALSAIQHRMHVDALKALCEVIQDYRPFHVFVEGCGFRAMTPTEALCAEYGAKMMAKKAIDADIRATLESIDPDEMRKVLSKGRKS